MGPAARVDLAVVAELLRKELPEVRTAYVFGSSARGDVRRDSDVDLAVLPPRAIDPVRRWDIAQRLATALRRDVDLVDLRTASAVLRAQVLRDGELLIDLEPSARAEFEMLVLADYARLNEERREILLDVKARGSVHGR